MLCEGTAQAQAQLLRLSLAGVKVLVGPLRLPRLLETMGWRVR